MFLEKRAGKGSKSFEPVVEMSEPLLISRIQDELSRNAVPKNINLLSRKTLMDIYELWFGFQLIFAADGYKTAKDRNHLAAFRNHLAALRRAIRGSGVGAGLIRQIELQVISQRNHRNKHPILNQAEIKALLSF